MLQNYKKYVSFLHPLYLRFSRRSAIKRDDERSRIAIRHGISVELDVHRSWTNLIVYTLTADWATDYLITVIIRYRVFVKAPPGTSFELKESKQ